MFFAELVCLESHVVRLLMYLIRCGHCIFELVYSRFSRGCLSFWRGHCAFWRGRYIIFELTCLESHVFR